MNDNENNGSGEAKRGPDPDRLNIEGDWQDAIKKALEKKKPEDGWPDPDEEGEDAESD